MKEKKEDEPVHYFRSHESNYVAWVFTSKWNAHRQKEICRCRENTSVAFLTKRAIVNLSK